MHFRNRGNRFIKYYIIETIILGLMISTTFLFPLVFFTLSYFVGRGIDVRTHCFAVAFSLFVGGASGALAGTVAALYYLAIAVPVAGSPATSMVEPFFVGFSAFFSGFSAMALSNFRMKNG